MSQRIDMTGWKMWEHGIEDSTIEVIQFDHATNKGAYWLCKCKNHPEIQEVKYGGQLRSGDTKHCSCCCLLHKKHNLLNTTFGDLTVIEKTDKLSLNGEYIWKAQCSCGNYRFVRTSGFLYDNIRCCEECGKKDSKGERKIKQILKENNICFEIEKQFNNCRFNDTNRMAKFDFFINNKYIIEFDGAQHFDSNNKWFCGEHDAYKNQWCKDNNIPIIRIPYTHYKDLCLEDLLLETSSFILS